ncbi:hypothetical protein [Sulfurimonas sp.]
MKKIILGLALVLTFIGCSSKSDENANVTPKLVVGESVKDIQLKDQFGKSHKIEDSTYKIIFAFSKDAAHTCNDFFNTQAPTYLQDHNTQFIADVSAAPSLIRSMFILPGLKDFKHTVLLLDDEEKAAPYRKGVNTEKIVVAYILNGKISEVKELDDSKEILQKTIEEQSPMSVIAPVVNEVMGKF